MLHNRTQKPTHGEKMTKTYKMKPFDPPPPDPPSDLEEMGFRVAALEKEVFSVRKRKGSELYRRLEALEAQVMEKVNE